MKKTAYAQAHGLTIRKVTEQDRAEARTDYQREAEYIISNGRIEWYSKRGSLNDMRIFVEYHGNGKTVTV